MLRQVMIENLSTRISLSSSSFRTPFYIQSMGRSPFLFFISLEDPFNKRIFTSLVEYQWSANLWTARCNGVFPSWSCTFGFAPHANKKHNDTSLLRYAAQCNGLDSLMSQSLASKGKFLSRKWIVLTLSPYVAIWIMLWPYLSFANTSAPLSIKNLIISLFPQYAAKCIAESPSKFCMFINTSFVGN